MQTVDVTEFQNINILNMLNEISHKLFMLEKELFMYTYMNYEFPFLKMKNQNQEKAQWFLEIPKEN